MAQGPLFTRGRRSLAFCPDVFFGGGFPQKPPRRPLWLTALFATLRRVAAPFAGPQRHGRFPQRAAWQPSWRSVLFDALLRASAPHAGLHCDGRFPPEPRRPLWLTALFATLRRVAAPFAGPQAKSRQSGRRQAIRVSNSQASREKLARGATSLVGIFRGKLLLAR